MRKGCISMRVHGSFFGISSVWKFEKLGGKINWTVDIVWARFGDWFCGYDGLSKSWSVDWGSTGPELYFGLGGVENQTFKWKIHGRRRHCKDLERQRFDKEHVWNVLNGRSVHGKSLEIIRNMLRSWWFVSLPIQVVLSDKRSEISRN